MRKGELPPPLKWTECDPSPCSSKRALFSGSYFIDWERAWTGHGWAILWTAHHGDQQLSGPGTKWAAKRACYLHLLKGRAI